MHYTERALCSRSTKTSEAVQLITIAMGRSGCNSALNRQISPKRQSTPQHEDARSITSLWNQCNSHCNASGDWDMHMKETTSLRHHHPASSRQLSSHFLAPRPLITEPWTYIRKSPTARKPVHASSVRVSPLDLDRRWAVGRCSGDFVDKCACRPEKTLHERTRERERVDIDRIRHGGHRCGVFPAMLACLCWCRG